MKLYTISTKTPVGTFHMILEREAGENAKFYDIVRAAGFGTLDDLKTRLPEELQFADFEKIVATKTAPKTAHKTKHKEHAYVQAVNAYFNGDTEALHLIPYKQEGSEFNHNVWRAMSNVKPGSTISYKELALQAGSPSAVRAAGTVCGQNRLILLVPCHRIIKSDGSIGNYLYGAKIKEYLLKLEVQSRN